MVKGGIKKPQTVGGPPAKKSTAPSKVTQSPFAKQGATPSKAPSKAPSKSSPPAKKSVPSSTANNENANGGIMGILMLVMDLLVFGAAITFAILTFMEISIFK